MSTFDSTKRLLPEILAEIVKAKIQLPDFQRGWVWDDQHIRSLLVSIARSFPVGAVMLLETGGEAKFQVRPVEGVTLPPGASDAELLILDGQQRLTTLTQVLATKDAVKTRTEKGKPIRRHYYWNIEVALEGGDRLEDAIEAIEEDKIKRSNFGRQIDLDLTTTQKECEQLYFPCDQILNSDAWEEALQEYAPEKFGLYMQFRRQVLNAFRNYQLPWQMTSAMSACRSAPTLGSRASTLHGCWTRPRGSAATRVPCARTTARSSPAGPSWPGLKVTASGTS